MTLPGAAQGAGVSPAGGRQPSPKGKGGGSSTPSQKLARKSIENRAAASANQVRLSNARSGAKEARKNLAEAKKNIAKSNVLRAPKQEKQLTAMEEGKIADADAKVAALAKEANKIASNQRSIVQGLTAREQARVAKDEAQILRDEARKVVIEKRLKTARADRAERNSRRPGFQARQKAKARRARNKASKKLRKARKNLKAANNPNRSKASRRKSLAKAKKNLREAKEQFAEKKKKQGKPPTDAEQKENKKLEGEIDGLEEKIKTTEGKLADPPEKKKPKVDPCSLPCDCNIPCEPPGWCVCWREPKDDGGRHDDGEGHPKAPDGATAPGKKKENGGGGGGGEEGGGGGGGKGAGGHGPSGRATPSGSFPEGTFTFAREEEEDDDDDEEEEEEEEENGEPNGKKKKKNNVEEKKPDGSSSTTAQPKKEDDEEKKPAGGKKSKKYVPPEGMKKPKALVNAKEWLKYKILYRPGVYMYCPGPDAKCKAAIKLLSEALKELGYKVVFVRDPKTGRLTLHHETKGLPGKKVKETEVTAESMKDLVGLLNGDSPNFHAELWVMDRENQIGDTYKKGSLEGTGLPLAQSGQDGKIFINVDSVSEYITGGFKKHVADNFGGKDPNNPVAYLYHELHEARGVQAGMSHDNAHKLALIKENKFRKEHDVPGRVLHTRESLLKRLNPEAKRESDLTKVQLAQWKKIYEPAIGAQDGSWGKSKRVNADHPAALTSKFWPVGAKAGAKPIKVYIDHDSDGVVTRSVVFDASKNKWGPPHPR